MGNREAMISIHPDDQFAQPHIQFVVSFDVGSPHLLLNIYGEVSICTDRSGSRVSKLGVLQLGATTYVFNPLSDGQRRIGFLLSLTRRGIEQIEEFRMQNPQNDVFLKVRITATVLFVRSSLIHLLKPGGAPERQAKILEMPIDTGVQEMVGIDQVERIAASDWVSQYHRAFGLGRYLVVEIPLELDEAAAKLKKMSGKKLAERIAQATVCLKKAEIQHARGEWRTCIRDVRDALEPISRGSIKTDGAEISVKKAVKDLIENSGLPEKARDAVSETIDRLQQYTSATHHVVEKGKTVEVEPPFDKEDAIFAFGTTAALINLLANKLLKQI